MDDFQRSTKGEKSARQESWLIVRLPLNLIEYLRHWASRKDVAVSAVVEEAITKLCEDLKTERRKRFQKARAERETLE